MRKTIAALLVGLCTVAQAAEPATVTIYVTEERGARVDLLFYIDEDDITPERFDAIMLPSVEAVTGDANTSASIVDLAYVTASWGGEGANVGGMRYEGGRAVVRVEK